MLLHRRTTKYMLGVLSGVWIVSISWMSACMGQGAAMPEEEHEVQRDCQGGQGGPILGRLHAAEHRQLLCSFEVCIPALSYMQCQKEFRDVHGTAWPLEHYGVSIELCA